ncbi:MAG: MAPEG family protein [Planktotalea sp.]|uniref:MAPEG family protein n=1 Tax=Planktotalea sp. TaxID=2029877 RepID=UPI003C719640
MLAVTSIYAGLIALIFIILSLRVIRYRRGNRISLGDAGDISLLKRMRAHANCAEYAPIGLLLLALVELSTAPVLAVHILGAMLLIGRALHAWGFSASPPVMGARVLGTVLTLSMILLSALGLVFHGLF